MKQRPNHRRYLQVLASMSAEARLQKAFELSSLSRDLFLHGLRRRFPEMNERELRTIMLERLAKCHNRNY